MCLPPASICVAVCQRLHVFVCVYAYFFLDIVLCVYPSVHSLSPSLLPSVPLIPECVTNGRSRCSALLCSASGDPSSVCVCVHEHVCVCIYSSHGGLRSCEKEAVQDAILQKGREGRGAVRRRYPPLAACSWASPGHRTSLYHAPPGPLELYCPAVSHPPFLHSLFSLSLVNS